MCARWLPGNWTTLLYYAFTFDPSYAPLSPAVDQRAKNECHTNRKTKIHCKAPFRFAAWTLGWEIPRKDTRQIKRKQRRVMKMKCSPRRQTVELLTWKSVPVHALISSGVSPSHTSIRVRPFVSSTSNTAWWTQSGRERERKGWHV